MGNRIRVCGVLSLTTANGGYGLESSEVVARARRGDPAAWETLVRFHQEAVFRYAYWLTGDPDEAADIAQDTFLRMMRSFDRYDASRPLRPWLIRIARNLARNRWRRARRAVAAVERWRVDRQLRESPPAGRAEGAADSPVAALHRVLVRLSDSDRQVLVLRYLLELNLEETASALGVPAGTVKSRTSRALGRLRSLARNDPVLRQALEP